MANDDLEHYVPIDVESLLEWVESREDPVNHSPSICEVPNILRELSPDSFTPQLVSIGPLHKNNPNVQAIERLKRSYLRDLLQRPTSPLKQPKTKLDDCLKFVEASIVKIKSCYSAPKYSDGELAIMMVMDACFIIEFCLKDYFEEPTLLNQIQKSRIAIDLMLLENQIPFFVLQYIFDLTKPISRSLSLTSLLYEVLSKDVHPFYILPDKPNFPHDFSFPNVLENSNDHKHVLDCLHKIYQFVDMPQKKEENALVTTTLNYVWNNMCKFCNCLTKKSENANIPHSVIDPERSGQNFKPWKEEENASETNNNSAVEVESSEENFKKQKDEENLSVTISNYVWIVLLPFKKTRDCKC